jgi:hypothetical protein
MSPALRARVRERAGYRCEYCQLRQEDSPLAALHIEHIVPWIHGGGDDLDNLALACIDCNLHKGPNLTGSIPKLVESPSCFIRDTSSGRITLGGGAYILSAKQPLEGRQFASST